MTIPMHHPISIPVSALLAPQDPPVPGQPLPSPSAALLGPLPPTSPLHLALNWLALSDLPEYESALSALTHTRLTEKPGGQPGAEIGTDGAAVKREVEQGKTGRRGRRRPARALIITSRKEDFYHALQEEDEDWMRDHGSDYGVLARLKRVDIRYCPIPQHLQLLMSLLTAQRDNDGLRAKADGSDAFTLDTSPGLIILYDTASLFMEWQGGDENTLPSDETMAEYEPQGARATRLHFKHSVKLSDYLDLVAAARSAIDYLSSSAEAKSQLVLLEPNLDSSSALPVLAPAAQVEGNDGTAVPANIRQKRIKVVDGLRWMLGDGAIGSISVHDTIAEDIHAPSFQITLASEPDFVAHIKRRRCGRGEWARSNPGEGDVLGDQGGWRWEWC